MSFAHWYFFCRCLELLNQTFLKASRPNCNDVFRPKKMNSLHLLVLERIKAEISLDRILFFKNNRSIYESRNVLVMTTAASRESVVLKVMTLLSPLNQWEFSVSGETGNSLFSKDVYSPSIFSLSPPPTQLNLPFRAGVQFSRDYIRAFKNRWL